MSVKAMSWLESARRKFFMNYEEGIKRLCAEEAEMSLTAIHSLESTRRKFFMKPTYTMSRK